MALSSIIVAGYVGRDAEMKYSQQGTPMLSWSMGVSQYDRQKQAPQTEWVNCLLFGERAEKIGERIVKGAKVTVMGDWRLNRFTRRDGSQDASLTLLVNQVDVTPPQPKRQPELIEQPDANTLDELPF